MAQRTLTEEIMLQYQLHLANEEKSAATIDKYLRDARRFAAFLGGRAMAREAVMEYKGRLLEQGYKAGSINSMLSSVNSLLTYLGRGDCRVKNIKIQRQIYTAGDRELKKAEYLRLVEASRARPRLCLLLQTICGTGIRVSELKYFTVESVRQGAVTVSCKNKTRVILIPGKLRKLLLAFSRKQGIRCGVIFRAKSGKPLNRSRIWAEMKRICGKAGVKARKVFPHNLRKLFARTFYGMGKDIVKLADILGHSSINTTRIYVMTTEMEHKRLIERLQLVI